MASNQLKDKKILVVDDIAQNLQLIASILNDEGFIISFAQNGNQAIEVAEIVLPDLILLDVNMPEKNGFEVCREMKYNHLLKEIPVIFITARDSTEDIIKGFEAGGADYITKPINAEILIKRVLLHLGLKHVYDTMNLQNQKLEELNSAKDKMFSIIAHDLRGPFFSIHLLTDVMAENIGKVDRVELEDTIININQTTKQVMNLLENLLDWSRLQTGRLDKNIEFQQVFTACQRAYYQVLGVAKQKNINLALEVDEKLNAYYDEFMLVTIIRNLLSNAIKFTFEGGTVKIKATDHKEGVEIAIEDTGTGMTEDIINTLFQVDKKKKTIGTNKEKGTGLGLLICDEFVKSMGGNISVESRIGRGSKFSFKLRKYEQISGTKTISN